MEKIQGAVITEQGITFAIVVVKSHVFNTSASKEEAIGAFSGYFPGMPIVLMRLCMFCFFNKECSPGWGGAFHLE